MTIKQASFYLIFLLSWLMLLLLGESYFSHVLLGGVSLSFLLFSNELEWRRVSNHRWLAILWLLFLSSVALSSLFSTSLPLSLYSATKYIFSFLVFWFFLLVKKSFISSKQTIELLLIVGVVVLLTSIIYQLSPDLANSLPGMNLIHATYGHNHLAALLLLLIPLSWWLAGEYIGRGESHWWWLLPAAFNMGLLYSFGRVAIVIGLIQFLFIYKKLKKGRLKKNSQPNFVFKMLAGLFSIVLLGNIFFSTATLINPNFACPVPELRKQLCKSVEAELRPKYWGWAGKIIKDSFWLGSGPGTFGIASKKYFLNPYPATSYAHNAFLESFTEMGFVGGGLFTLLMLGLLCVAWGRSWKKRNWGWRQAAFLGVSSVYLDVFFDFDWGFVGIFTITLILLAILIKNDGSVLVKKSVRGFLKTAFYMFVFILILIAGLYLKTDLLIRSNKFEQAFNIFPYFHWHKKIFTLKGDLPSSQRQELKEIYQYHPDAYRDLIGSATSLLEKQQLEESWAQLDPWQLVYRYKKSLSYYIDRQDWDGASQRIDLVIDFFELVEEKSGDYKFDQSQKITLSEQILKLADHLYARGQYELAGNYYVQAHLKNDLILGMHEPVFADVLSSELVENPEQKILFFRQIGKIEGSQYFGKFLTEYTDAYLKVAESMIDNGSIDQIEEMAAEILLINPQAMSFVKEKLLLPLIDLNHHHISSQKSFLIWQLLLENGYYHHNYYQMPLIEKLIANNLLEEAEKIIVSISDWDQVLLSNRKKIITSLQLKSDLGVKNQNFSIGFKVFETMKIVQQKKYWVMVQPANLAVLKGDYDQAKQLFQQCLDYFSNFTHEDCRSGLEDLIDNQSKLDRYWQVSQIIRDEATWQDFSK